MGFKNLLIGASLIAASASAQAIPTLESITGQSIFAGITDSGAESVTLTDTDGLNDSVIASMLLENAGYESSFGIYSFTDDGFGSIVVDSRLEVFDGAVEPNVFGTQAVFFDLDSSLAWVDGSGGTSGVYDSAFDTAANIGATFGFYLDIPAGKPGDIWYSHTSLNSDGVDHVGIFETLAFNGGVTLAWEDLNNGGDWDYNDMVVGVSNVAVAEPATLALMGLGLAGLGAVRRRQAS